MASEKSRSAQMQQSSRMGSLPEAGSGEDHFDAMPTATFAQAGQLGAWQHGNACFPTPKRRASSTGDHATPKRRHISSGTSSSNTFANLKITKPTSLDQGGIATTYYVPSPVSSWTVDSQPPQSIGAPSARTLDHPPLAMNHINGGQNSGPQFQKKTTVDRLTPRLTESSQHLSWDMDEAYGSWDTDEVYGTGRFVAPSTSAGSPEQHGWQKEDATVQPNMHDDEYPIDNEDEEDMIRLCNDVNTVSKPQFPPSSVANAWDRDSRTVEEYDPTLQHSSIQSTPDSGIEVQQNQDQGGADEDLLDDDVDWDAVYTITNTIPKDDSLVGDRELKQRHKEAAAATNDETGDTLTEPLTGLPQARPLNPFTRPPFPAKVRDRPSVLGLSSSTVLRVCFRVEELMQEATHCHHQDQEAIFELYARVTYSSRERMVKKQHFQFRDLFEDKQPFPSGTLSGWRPDGLLDQQSQVFLGTRTPQLCWILTKPHRDSKSSVGLTLDIISIRETTWDEIRLAKAITCGEEVEEEAEETTSVS